MTLTIFEPSSTLRTGGSSTSTTLLSNAARAIDFHRRLPGYQPSELLNSTPLGEELGFETVYLKLELQRFGLPSFKFLGAAFAAYLAIQREIGFETDWQTLSEFGAGTTRTRPLRLTTATDGNHGRAIARFAKLLGISAKIYVPTPTAIARIEAIRSEGAEVIIVDDDYDTAVKVCASEATDYDVIVSDTSWDGYEQTPRDVVDGYQTIFSEIDSELTTRQLAKPTSIVIPVGVGGLAAAAAQWLDSNDQSETPLVIVEPNSAACVTAALVAGELVTLSDTQQSSMAGLNCGTASAVALERLKGSVAGSITVTDAEVDIEISRLADTGTEIGESGAAGIAGIAKAMRNNHRDAQKLLGSRPLVVVTEGVTDPVNFERIVGRSPRA